jgi:hypothetical protein
MRLQSSAFVHSDGVRKNQEVMADTYYSTAPQELWTEPLSEDRHDATTSSRGEHTYYSTAPQELWTELLPKDLQDQNFVSKTQTNESESSCVEVHLLEQSDLL